MSISTQPRPPTKNYILDRLPEDEYDHLFANLEPVPLPHNLTVQEPGQPISYVYFVTDGVISVVSITEEGGSVEVGIAGYEGMVNIQSFLGDGTSPYRSNVQIPGHAMRINANIFQDESNRTGMLQVLMRRYTQVLMNQV